MDNIKDAPILDIGHDSFMAAVDSLVRQIGSDHKFTCIVPIPRGGMVPAAYLAHRLDLPIKSIDGCFEESEVILFVEDVVDTGVTLDNLRDDGILTAEDAVATIVYKPWSVFRPDFYAIITEMWVKYDWETK